MQIVWKKNCKCKSYSKIPEILPKVVDGKIIDEIEGNILVLRERELQPPICKKCNQEWIRAKR